MNGYYSQVTAVLKQHRFSLVRCKGSHETWKCGDRCITVSRNMPSRHMANEIMKQAGINHRF